MRRHKTKEEIQDETDDIFVGTPLNYPQGSLLLSPVSPVMSD